MTSNYEGMMVFSLKNGEEGAVALQEKFADLITSNGTMTEEATVWGKRKLAYDINKESDGYYVIFNFSCENSFPEEIYRVAKITDGVLRTIIVKK